MNSSPDCNRIPRLADIESAAEGLRGIARRTPILEFDALNDQVGARVLLKCEMFQEMGAFKIRGAWNLLSRLTDRKKGVVTFSSGNHAQAVALAAGRLGVEATIVMPADAPRVKIDRTRSYGAGVILYDRVTEDREKIAADVVARTGAIMISPYDHADIIAGQGTVGLEILQQCGEMGIELDAAFIPCSGGGLVAGCALAMRSAWPRLKVFAAEPEGFDDTRRSLITGTREVNTPGSVSICDALLVPTPGELTFQINRSMLAGGVAVSDSSVETAMRIAFSHGRLVTEPGGAVGLAAVLQRTPDVSGQTVCAVLSGGNCDPDLFAKIISADTTREGRSSDP